MSEIVISTAIYAAILVILIALMSIYSVIAVSTLFKDIELSYSDYFRTNEKISIIAIYNNTNNEMITYIRNLGSTASVIKELWMLDQSSNRVQIARWVSVEPGGYVKITSTSVPEPLALYALTARGNLFVGIPFTLSRYVKYSAYGDTVVFDSPYDKAYRVLSVIDPHNVIYLPSGLSLVERSVFISTEAYSFAFLYYADPSDLKNQFLPTDNLIFFGPLSTSNNYTLYRTVDGRFRVTYFFTSNRTEHGYEVGEGFSVTNTLTGVENPGLFVFTCFGTAHKAINYNKVEIKGEPRKLYLGGVARDEYFIYAMFGSLVLPSFDSYMDIFTYLWMSMYKLIYEGALHTQSIDIAYGTSFAVLTFICYSAYSRGSQASIILDYNTGELVLSPSAYRERVCSTITYGSSTHGCTSLFGVPWDQTASFKIAVESEMIAKMLSSQ